MKHCIILGDNSDIAKRLRGLFVLDDWTISGWHRKGRMPTDRWDLILSCIGNLQPVGHWSTCHGWSGSVIDNLVMPFVALQNLWEFRKPNAAVCFMAGSNPNQPHIDHSAYYVSKMGIIKLAEVMDAETPDTKFFSLGPGYVKTKMTTNERERESTPIPKIYECLKWCLEQPKEIIGGRNVCVSDSWGDELTGRLADECTFKLRRFE